MLLEHVAVCSTYEDACHIEQLLIRSHNTKVPNGYNMTEGGEGSVGVVMSDSTLEKFKLANKGRTWTAEQNLKRSETVKLQWQDAEFREKRSALMRKPKKEGFREMRSNAAKEQHRKKTSKELDNVQS